MPRRRNSQRVNVKHWKYFGRPMYILQYNQLKRNGFWIRWHRRAVQSSSTVCDSIDRHARVLRATENSARSMTCSGRATLKEKSDHWSLPPSRSEELFEAILGWKYFRRPEGQRDPAFIGFILTFLVFFSSISFSSSNCAIYLTIALSSHLLESTNAFFLLLLAITALCYLSLFSLFVWEEAYCQFRERTVNRDKLNRWRKIRGSATFPYNKINSHGVQWVISSIKLIAIMIIASSFETSWKRDVVFIRYNYLNSN